MKGGKTTKKTKLSSAIDKTLKEFNQNAYINERRKTHTKRITILLNNNTDKKIINKLESVKNKSGYIKDLINKDITKK